MARPGRDSPIVSFLDLEDCSSDEKEEILTILHGPPPPLPLPSKPGVSIGHKYFTHSCAGLVTSSILLYYLFTINERCAKVRFQQTHNQGLRQLSWDIHCNISYLLIISFPPVNESNFSRNSGKYATLPAKKSSDAIMDVTVDHYSGVLASSEFSVSEQFFTLRLRDAL